MVKVNLTKDYGKGNLSKVDPCPFSQFAKWYKQAELLDSDFTNAMVLATVDPSGQPHSRVVLLKEWSEQGFVFFTDYGSAKAQHLQQQPKAALLFWWEGLERQIRIEGSVAKISEQASREYFYSRPLASQVAAYVSNQSQSLDSIDQLRQKQKQLVEHHQKNKKPVPFPHWGGYRVSPELLEFWQGGVQRLHDRFVYRKQATSWIIERLAP